MERYNTQSFEVILHDNGIVETKALSDWNMPDTVETITEHALLLKKIINGKRRGILGVVPNLYMKKELIEIYNNINIGQVAGALLVNSFGTRVLGNLAMRLKKRPYPIRMFTDRKEAEAWLLKIMSESD